MDQEKQGARRIVQLTVHVQNSLSDEPQQLSEVYDDVPVEAAEKTRYRVLSELQEMGQAVKVNADGDPDDNGRKWIQAERQSFDSNEPILPDDYFELFGEYDHTPNSEDELDPFPYSIKYSSDVEIEVEWFAEKVLSFTHDSYRFTVYYAPKDTQKDDDWIARRLSDVEGIREMEKQDYDEVSERYATVEEALERLEELVIFEFDWE